MAVRWRMAAAVTVTVLTALALPAAASAGGWATVGLDPLPGTPRAGEPWNVELTLLQHGRTPLEEVEPAITIRPAGGGDATTFRATETGRPGVYAARVVFPSGGAWSYEVDDGFAARHAFGDVRVTGRAAAAAVGAEETRVAGDGGGSWPWTWVAVVAALAAGLGAALLVSRVRRGPRAALPG